MSPTLYVETSVASYLTARPTRDVLASAWQETTKRWWKTQRTRFVLFTSQLVLEEAGEGHPEAAERRLKALSGISLLAIPKTVDDLADELLRLGALPQAATVDALHVAIAAYHGIDYLLTWNCRHINNGEMKPLMRSICSAKGCVCPEICTPLELMGGDDNEG